MHFNNCLQLFNLNLNPCLRLAIANSTRVGVTCLISTLKVDCPLINKFNSGSLQRKNEEQLRRPERIDLLPCQLKMPKTRWNIKKILLIQFFI